MFKAEARSAMFMDFFEHQTKSTKQKGEMMIPTMIQLESSTACDAACIFCPHSKMQRQGGIMKEELFDKILSESEGITEILLFLNGEPLLFPHLFEWLEKLRLNHKTTVLFTNGNALTMEKAERLIEYSDVIRVIVFSLGGIDEESYRKIMGLDYARVRSNIEYFHKINNGVIRTEGHIPYFTDTAPFISEWHVKWSGLVDSNSPTAYFNFAGSMPDPMELKEDEQHQKTACGRLNHIAVLWDGRVCLCCMDAEGQVILGDINDGTIAEIFNGYAMNYYREKHADDEWAELKLCKDCNMNIIAKESECGMRN